MTIMRLYDLFYMGVHACYECGLSAFYLYISILRYIKPIVVILVQRLLYKLTMKLLRLLAEKLQLLLQGFI